MPKVKFINTGALAEIPLGGALKDPVKDNGWPIAFGCEDGVCGTCVIRVPTGFGDLSPMEETEDQTLEMMCLKDGEHRLCCQCKVNGDVEIEGM